MEKTTRKEYQAKYYNDHYIQKVVALPIEEAKELDELLSTDTITFTALVKKAIYDYKENRKQLEKAKELKFKEKKKVEK